MNINLDAGRHLADAMHALPLFPLPRVVLLPHTLLPLHVFEPRYRALVERCIAHGGVFGIPRIQDAQLDGDVPAVHPVMGLARLVRHQPLPDGRSNIVVLGVGRARLCEELTTDTPWRSGRCTLIDDIQQPDAPAPGMGRLMEQLRLAAFQVVSGREDVTTELERLLTPDRHPGEVVDVLAHMCLRDPDDRQAYLEHDTIRHRAEHVLATLTMVLHQARPTAHA